MAKRSKLENWELGVIWERYVAGTESVKEISGWAKRTHGIEIGREAVHRTVRDARKRGFVRFRPPRNLAIQQQLAERFGKDPGSIVVLDSKHEYAREHVPGRAAELTASLIQDVGRVKERVDVALGGGETIRKTVDELALELGAAVGLPALRFHAASVGFDVFNPQTAPVSFFGMLGNLPTSTSYVALIAQAVVPTEDYEKVRRLPGLVEAFEAARDVDLVVTSIASAKHKHGTLRQFAATGGRQGFKTDALEAAGWEGDVLYGPFSGEGPIEVDSGVQAVSLFNLQGLWELAQQKDKYVIVVVTPCQRCGELKTSAVRPLLECDELAVWTHMVLDLGTAEALLD
jgi:DNA-binding transcriptional regulator LsrR (DeoR family)